MYSLFRCVTPPPRCQIAAPPAAEAQHTSWSCCGDAGLTFMPPPPSLCWLGLARGDVYLALDSPVSTLQSVINGITLCSLLTVRKLDCDADR